MILFLFSLNELYIPVYLSLMIPHVDRLSAISARLPAYYALAAGNARSCTCDCAPGLLTASSCSPPFDRILLQASFPSFIFFLCSAVFFLSAYLSLHFLFLLPFFHARRLWYFSTRTLTAMVVVVEGRGKIRKLAREI